MSITTDDLRARLSLGVVAVIGAGLSLSARYPDTKNLTGLLWDAVDYDVSARAGLAERLGAPDGSAKSLIGDCSRSINEAWATIAGSAISRGRFQRAFVALDADRACKPSKPHEALARLIHEGSVELVVSFNWDSALEKAYERLYGTSLPVELLYKPHGDVAQPDQPWILPHQDGTISDGVHAKVSALVDEHARTLIIIGYSGSDPTVVDQLIAPLDERWRVTRVSPNATGPDDVAGTAADVLGDLAQPAADMQASSAWSVVTFGNQRGIESALAGHRLSPRDVEACPRLPAVDAVCESLLRTHAVVLNGDSGSGKSISAYQVAREFALRGYEVLRLRDSKRLAGMGVWLDTVNSFPNRKLLFIDDAQDLSADTVRELAETATQDQLVLIAGVDHIAGGVVTHTIASAAAVGLLERFMLDNRAEMLPKVRQLDNWIGDGIADDRFEFRVEQAAKERNAWLFFYSLSGGWRRTTRILQEIRERDRADILAYALAVAQIAGVDSGVTVKDLTSYAATLGRNQKWVEDGLAVLKMSQLAFEQDGVWRCPHLRSAHAIINWLLHPPVLPASPMKPRIRIGPIASADVVPEGNENRSPARNAQSRSAPRLPEVVVEEDRKNAITLLEVALNSPLTSMRGIAWLLGQNTSGETQRVLRKYGIRTPERDRALAIGALATPPGPDVVMAAQLLEQLADPDAPEIVATIWDHLDSVIEWIRTVTPQNGWAIGNLVNALINDDRERLAAAISTIDSSRLVQLYKDGGWPHIYSTSGAVNRISQGGGTDLLVAVGAAFDETTLEAMLDAAPSLASANELLAMFPYTNPEMGIRLFDSHAERFTKAFSRNPLGEYNAMFKTFAFLLGYAPGFLRHRKPRASQRRVTLKFLRALDTNQLVYELARPQNDGRWHNFSGFISMFHEADPVGCAKVADAVDLGQLEQTLVEHLPAPSGNILFVLSLLVETRPEAVLSLLDCNQHELESLDSDMAFIHPELVVRLLKRGLALDLNLEGQRYENAATVLDIIGALHAEIAGEVAETNSLAFAAGLAANHAEPFLNLHLWVSISDRYAPGLVDKTMASLEAGVVTGWAKALRSAKSKREIGPLVARAARLRQCPAAIEAYTLLMKFPSLKGL